MGIFYLRVREGMGVYEAIYRWGYKLKEVGELLGLHYSRVSRIASKGAKNKIGLYDPRRADDDGLSFGKRDEIFPP